MSPNSKILIGLEFLFYGPVRVGVRFRVRVRVRVGFRARIRVKVRARVKGDKLGDIIAFSRRHITTATSIMVLILQENYSFNLLSRFMLHLVDADS